MKKILYSIGIVVIFLVVIAVIKFLPEKEMGIATPDIRAEEKCNPYSNIEEAVLTGDLKSCDCLKKELEKNKCITTINDATFYTTSLKQLNISLCDKISQIEMRKACLVVVKSKIDFAQNNLATTSSDKK